MRILLFSSLLFSFSTSYAQNSSPDSAGLSSTNELKEVVVRGIKDNTERKTSANAKLVFTSKDFERFELSTIGDYMRTLPGVVMDKGNEAKDIKFRGMDKEYTQVLIDGERIPDGGEKREFQVDRIPLNMVERIEILRSPVAGIDAQGMAGTINIILKKSNPHPTLRINASLGKVEDNGSVYDGYLQYGNKLGKKADFLLNGGYQTRVAPKTKTKESYSGDVLKSSEEENEAKKYKEANFAPRLNWRISDKHNVNLDPMYLYSQEDKQVVKPAYKVANGTSTLNATEDNTEVKDRTGWALRGTYTFKPSAKHEILFRPQYQKYYEEKDKLVYKYNAAGTQTEKSTELEKKYDIEWINRVTYNYYGKSHFINLGVESGIKDRNRDKTKTKNDVVEKNGVKDLYSAKENRWNVFVSDEIKIGQRHTITPSLRWEYTSASNTSYFTNAAKEDTSVAGKNSYNILNPYLNYLFKINNHINFRAGFARTVRRPQFDDLTPYYEQKGGTLVNPDNLGNPLLVPETSLGGDAGLEYYLGKNSEKGVVGFNAFYRNVNDYMENLVNLDPLTNRYFTHKVNAGNGKVWGFEMDARYNIDVPHVGLFIPKGNYSILRSEVLDSKTQQKRKFKGQPDYVYNIGIEYVTPKKRLSVGANFNKVPINKEAETKTDGSYEVKENTDIQRLDVFVNYSVTRKIAVRLAGQNLFTQTKEVQKRVYTSEGALTSFDVERENYSSTFMLSVQWNIW